MIAHNGPSSKFGWCYLSFIGHQVFLESKMTSNEQLAMLNLCSHKIERCLKAHKVYLHTPNIYYLGMAYVRV